ncbi:MAG: phenylalanine--tRNA ligase subunit beta, partial [Candidatus Diapherotrites archaeon]
MPKVECSKKDLEALVGKKFSKEELEEAVLFVKGELDAMDGDKIVIDIKDPNRPDLWSAEGIARALRAAYGKEKGAVKISTKKSNWKLLIDKSVEEVRPVMVAAIARNIRVTEDFLIQMIQLQEKV